MDEQKEKKYTAIVIDTLNGIQNDNYIEDLEKKGKLGFDDWKDYGVDIYRLYLYLKETKCTIVQVLGIEGSGKTVGAYFLDPESTIYVNADKKPLTFTDAYKMYPTDSKRYKEPKNGPDGYEQIKSWVKAVTDGRCEYPNNLVVFCLAHVDFFKDNGADRQRMRTLGKLASKMNIEGSVIHSYYTEVDTDMSIKDEERYKFLTRNTGRNTGRSPMGIWKVDKIPNNFNLILYKTLKAKGIEHKYQNKKIDNLNYEDF